MILTDCTPARPWANQRVACWWVGRCARLIGWKRLRLQIQLYCALIVSKRLAIRRISALVPVSPAPVRRVKVSAASATVAP
jgi:hypothetical protein